MTGISRSDGAESAGHSDGLRAIHRWLQTLLSGEDGLIRLCVRGSDIGKGCTQGPANSEEGTEPHWQIHFVEARSSTPLKYGSTLSFTDSWITNRARRCCSPP